MSTEQQPSRPTRGGGAAPVGSTIAIVVAVVAVVVGFLILRDLRDDSESGGTVLPPGSTDVTVTTTDPTATTVTTAPSVTTTTLVTAGANVVVANASGVSGSAGTMSTALAGRGFATVDPTNSAERPERTRVFFLPGAEAVATSVGQVLGGITAEPMPTPIPVEGAAIGEAQVLVLLGKDLAGLTLDQIGAGQTNATTTVAPTAAPSTSAGG